MRLWGRCRRSRVGRLFGVLGVLAVAWCVAAIPAAATEVINTISVGASHGPWDVSSDGTHAWVANSLTGSVSEINAASGTVEKTITVGSGPTGVSSTAPTSGSRTPTRTPSARSTPPAAP